MIHVGHPELLELEDGRTFEVVVDEKGDIELWGEGLLHDGRVGLKVIGYGKLEETSD